MTQSPAVTRSSRSSRLFLLVCLTWVLLFGVQCVDALQRGVPWVIWAGKLLPLLLFVPGMLRDRLRSFIWLCFVVLLYFITLVERLFAQPDSALASVGMVAVVGLFVSAMLYVKVRGPELRAGAEGASAGEDAS
jgi:uncharacterized membrane protein